MQGRNLTHMEMCRYLSCLALRRTIEFQNLYCFRKNQLAIDTFLCHIANHTVACKELSELLEGASTTIADVVVTIITKCDGVLRCICRGVNGIAKDLGL